MKVLFQADIDAATNEDYGSGSLSPERKRIFTTYRSQIGTLSLLTEIKELIKSLVKAEKFIAEFKNLDKMASATKLKEEYRNGSGDKKSAYAIVNQVDNQKDPQILLAESRTQLKTKYANDTVAQAIFDNEVLDSAAALQAAEKLLIKVREAEAKNDVDASLLTLLQAVNSHNQQAETALAHLQKVNQSREEIVKTLQEAKNENSELYKQGGKTKKVIRSLRQRKQVSFRLDQENFSTENKVFLQTALVKLIPETIKDDNDEKGLTELENQLKTFQTTSESEEKGQIYQKYKKTIDQLLTEIRQEKQRYQQTKLQDSNEEQKPTVDNQNPSSDSRLPD
ncbi:2008_t:CDS:2 [Ambispora gerdemannii]|uniref:2008_t:CDS:1 n=1 Tax=Ambispora gerdemannii TaxID=144530 RepID=A0A9N8VHF1_9GLOM|nr:2008_t:CDS:2 [Ambispora gerdemannii]